MFKVENEFLELINVTYRELGYGCNDLGAREKSFLWRVNIVEFMITWQNEIDNFINQCVVDDKNLEEPDIDYLYKLDYPSAEKLTGLYPYFFCNLIFDYPDLLVYYPFFNHIPPVESGFSINRLDKVVMENDKILLIGVGYYGWSLFSIK